jgi:NitT/TauT family transport system ATP-binding protein
MLQSAMRTVSMEGAPALAQPVLSARGVSKTYRTSASSEVVALRNVDFDIQPGELISLVGPSGCGKSTLLRLLAGLITVSGGNLLLDGTPIRGPGPKAAVVFQAPILLPWRTILQNVMLPIEFRELPFAQYQDRAKSLLDMVGLRDFHDRYPHELSGGMQQRAAIVRAMVQDPQILLMDEPFGALDAMTREQMNMEVLKIWERDRKTIVFVTHSITEAIFLSHRVFVMTSRPGTVAEIIDVDLPFPRTLSMVNTPAFGVHAARVRDCLQAHGDLS